MKKLNLLFLVFVLINMSCSSDDDGGSIDPIIGTWTFYKLFENNVEVPLENCEDLETFVFSSNGNIDYEYFEEDGSGNCIIEEDISGTWTNDGNSVYTINFTGTPPATEPVTFENNTFYITDTYTDNGMTITDRYVYIRN